MVAAKNDKSYVVKLLAKAGANLEAVAKDKKTPIHFAAYSEPRICVHELISRGARADITDMNGSRHRAKQD